MKKDWEKGFQDFLKYASKELQRLGKDLKQEAQELLKEVKPENKEKLKKGLQGVADWIKLTAKEVQKQTQKEGATKTGFCTFGKTKKAQTTWGEPVEKIHPEPPESKKTSGPKVTSKAKKTSAPKATSKTKTNSKPKKQTAPQKAPSAKAPKTTKTKKPKP